MDEAWARKRGIPPLREALARVRGAREEPEAVRLLGYAHYRAAEYDRAAQLLRQVSRLEPRSHETWEWLAQSETALGRWVEAETAWRFAICTAPTKKRRAHCQVELVRMLDEAYKYERAYCLRLREAESLTNEVLEGDPKNARAHYALARFKLTAREHAEAVHHFRQAARLFAAPDEKVWAHAAAAICLRGLGRVAEARREVAAALKVDPANEYARWIASEVERAASHRAPAANSSARGQPGG